MVRYRLGEDQFARTEALLPARLGTVGRNSNSGDLPLICHPAAMSASAGFAPMDAG